MCFGRASKSKIEVDSKTYAYQAWKIDRGGAIVYSTDDIQELEEELIDYLKRKKPSS